MEFHTLDVVVLIVYFSSMAALGPIFARRSRTTEGYFLGDRAFPGWLVGFSMFATSISSITFMAYPADAYKTAWLRMTPNFMLPVAVLMAAHIFLPFFRRGRITSAYEYLEGRFGPNVRLYAACAYILAQMIRISMILFLVSQVVLQVTGLNPILSVIIAGTITSFYTVTGGIRAVMWTDFIQAIVLLFGGVICVLVIAWRLGGPFEGLAEILRTGIADGKFAFADLEGDTLQKVPWALDRSGESILDISGLTQKTVLLMLLMGLGNWISEYSGNQNVIQRYCASRSARDARTAMWICCWFSVPTWALFMFLGTSLHVFYQRFPTAEALAMKTGAGGADPERILPYFVVHELPIGLSGLVIAAVLAAAMSSISASMNGVSVVSIVDVYRRRIMKDRSDRHYVLVAKGVGIAQAVIMIVGAALLIKLQSKTLQDTANQLTALSSAGLAGLYLLGFLTVRCDGRAAGIGIFCMLSFTIWMALTKLHWLPEAYRSPIDTYYAGLIGHIVLFCVGYAVGSLFLTRRKPVPHNLSVWSQDATPLD